MPASGHTVAVEGGVFLPLDRLDSSAVTALKPRIPTLKIEMDGLVLPDAVTVDGVNLDVTGLTKPQPFDPGTYVVVAMRNEKPVTQRNAATHPGVTATPQTKTKTTTQQYAMWTCFGTGAAGMIVGTTTGLMVLSKHSNLKDAGCSSDECFPSMLTAQGRY